MRCEACRKSGRRSATLERHEEAALVPDQQVWVVRNSQLEPATVVRVVPPYHGDSMHGIVVRVPREQFTTIGAFVYACEECAFNEAEERLEEQTLAVQRWRASLEERRAEVADAE